MTSVSPTSKSCPAEPHTGQGAYLKFEITSVSDSDAATNKRYVSWKITFQGTPWVQLFKAYATLGSTTIYNGEPGTTGWSVGTVLASNTTTFDNDSSGNLSLSFYMKQLFYYGTWSWDRSGYPQDCRETFVFSQLPRYANFTSHTATSEINKITVTYAADANYKAQQYSLNGGAWTDCTAGSYNLTGLSANTSYTIKTKIQRTDSDLWTESDTITIKTKALPTSIAPADIAFNGTSGNTFTPSISSMDYITNWYVMVYDGSTQVRSFSGSPSTATSKAWTLTASDFTNMLSRHTTSDNWDLTVKYRVVSNGTTYSLADKTFKCTIPAGQYTPTYNESNLSYAVTDTLTKNLNNNATNKVIKGISTVRVTSTAATPKNSATIVSYLASSGDVQETASSTTAPINIDLVRANGNGVSVQAVDSRGRSTIATKAFTAAIDYIAPRITASSIVRLDGIGTNLVVSIEGTYTNWSGLATNNTVEQVSIQYRLKGASTWTTISGITLTRTVGSGNFKFTGNITGNYFVATNEYEVLITLKDKIGNFALQTPIPAGEALLWRDMANKRIGINKKPTQSLDVAGNANVDNTLYSNLIRPTKGIISGSARLTTPNVDHQYPDSRMSSYEIMSTSSMNSSGYKPVDASTDGDGFIKTFFWDNDGLWDSQIYIPNRTLTDKIQPMFRSRNGGAWLNNWIKLSLLAYPIGSIYMSVNNTNPQTLFGGTWVQLKDRFLLGAGNTYTNGSTGGYAATQAHTHGIPALTGSTTSTGAHGHRVTDSTTSYGSGSQSGWRCLSWSGTSHDWWQDVYTPSDGGGHNHNIETTASTTNSFGTGATSDKTDGNMPPYLVVYMWKRTA